MQAIALQAPGGLNHLTSVAVEPRAPDPFEVQVEVKASSLNFHDYAVVTGLIPTASPRIPLSDAAGVVTAVGSGVTHFEVGERVMSHFFPQWASGRPTQQALQGVPGDHVDGFAAQTVTMPERAFGKMPSNLDFASASTLSCAALTAWRALVVETQLRPGDWVLVQGSGGVSVFGLQFARLMGCHVIATSSSNDKLERLKALGASAVVNYCENPNWGEAVLDLTGGRGVDLVIEVGGPGNLPQSVRGLAVDGCISLIGVLTGFAGEVPTAELMSKNGRISGITVGSHSDQTAMVAAIEAHNIQPVIDSTFALDNLAAAFRHQESQQHFGKICIEVS